MLVRAVVSWVLLGAGGALVRAQTAADVYGDVTILSTSIPGACTVVCTPFHTDLAVCLVFNSVPRSRRARIALHSQSTRR